METPQAKAISARLGRDRQRAIREGHVRDVVALCKAHGKLRPDGLIDPKDMAHIIMRVRIQGYQAGIAARKYNIRQECIRAEKPREVGRELEASSWARPEAG